MGTGNFIEPSGQFTYTVNFENEASASAPAQTVTVTEQLDPNLDWNTFQFGNIGFGNYIINVPPDRTSFSTRVDATATLGVYVDVTASFNVQTGQITWTFTSLDPATLDLPMDPLAGFLPPNSTAPAGQGFVTYTVNPKANLTTGTKINAQATVVFDTNPPINTAQQFNTIISSPPTSSVNPLPATSSPNFTVNWASGSPAIASYTVYVSDNGGAFTPWLTNTTQTSATYSGQVGHQYSFYSVATDLVGLTQPTPSGAQATTFVSVPTPPPPPPPPPHHPPTLQVPPLLAFFDSLLGGVETINANGIETITDSIFGIPLIVANFDSTGTLTEVTFLGINVTLLFELL